MDFYSARLLFVVLVDQARHKKTNTYDESIVVFRARDFQDAFRRALELGRSREKEYENHKRQRVRWAFKEVVNLDFVGSRVDGKEVASKLFRAQSEEPIEFEARFLPEKSKPDQSF